VNITAAGIHAMAVAADRMRDESAAERRVLDDLEARIARLEETARDYGRLREAVRVAIDRIEGPGGALEALKKEL